MESTAAEIHEPTTPGSNETPGTFRASLVGFLPIALVTLSLFTWIAFQTVMLFKERTTLQSVRQNQEKTVQDSIKLRNQLDSIAKGTAALARSGNAGAKTIVEELRKRGVTIKEDAPPPTK